MKASVVGSPERYLRAAFMEDSEKRQNALIADLARAYSEEGIALYLGAGVGYDLGLLTWQELVKQLVTRVMLGVAMGPDYKAGADRRGDTPWPWSYKHLERAITKLSFTENRSLEMLGRLVAQHSEGDLPLTVSSRLYWNSVLGECMVEDKWPKMYAEGEIQLDADLFTSPLLRSVVELMRRRPGISGVLSVVNYNFDDIFDEIMRTGGIPCQTIGSPDDALLPGRVPCYHVHGVVPSRAFVAEGLRRRARHPRKRVPVAAGNFVFSEDQYYREYSEPYRWSNLTQTLMLSSCDGVFVGSSLKDPNMRRLLDAIHRQFPQRRQYAILKRGRSLEKSGRGVADYVVNLFEHLETAAFEDLGVHVLWVDRFEDVPRLLMRVLSTANGEAIPRLARMRPR